MVKNHEQLLHNIDETINIKHRFSEGMSNFTYLCENQEGQKYVFRVPGDNAQLFVNFETEIINVAKIDDLKINSTTLYIDKNGLKLAKYLEGTSLKDVKDYDLNKITSLLKKLHTSEISFSEEYNHLERLKKYESYTSKNNSEQYYELKNKFIANYQLYLKEHIKYPSHGDSQKSNFIFNQEEKIYHLLDWEFAAQNDYIYDIASFGNNDINDAVELLKVYESNVDDNKLIRLFSWRMFQCLQWHNVAMYKNESGLGEKLGINFEQIALNYLLLANQMYENANKYIN